MDETPKKKKSKSRIRQTPTPFQKTFKKHQQLIGHFAWRPLLPEFIHIALALLESDYVTVKKDFVIIGDYINKKSNIGFHFNLSHTIRLLKTDRNFFTTINNTCFGSVIQTIITFYGIDIPIISDEKLDFKPQLLIHAYYQLLDGRNDTSILCKYIMMQYHHRNSQDPFELFNIQNKDEILNDTNISKIFAAFPPSTGQSQNFDRNFCNEIWLFNYCNTPFIMPNDMTETEEERFNEVKMDEMADNLRSVYEDFKSINLLLIFSREVAETNIGFVGRVCNLTLDVIELERIHKAEIAELTSRTILETFIVATWLNKRKDPELWQRFRSFSIGKDRFMVEKLAKVSEQTNMEDEAREIKNKVFEEMGTAHINIAEERGDIFDMKLDQMAEEVWGKDNKYYLNYKRYSDVIHGHWRVITKYHLAKSLNPMQAELLYYNENNNRFAGLVPSFVCIDMALNMMSTIVDQIDSPEVLEMKNRLQEFKEGLNNTWWDYFNKYIRLTNK